MKKLLLAASLLETGCTMVRDSEVPATDRERCEVEMLALEDACEQANVIGENDNLELYQAMDEVKECLLDGLQGIGYEIWCSDTGLVKIVDYNLKSEPIYK